MSRSDARVQYDFQRARAQACKQALVRVPVLVFAFDADSDYCVNRKNQQYRLLEIKKWAIQT